MTSETVRRVSECFVKPLHDLSQDTKQPIYFNPFELVLLNLNYSQKGLLFAKPPPQNQDFSITAFLDDLKHSLSATLTHFYPLAARLATRKQENPPSYVIYIDPENSPGVKFVHATVDVTVHDIVTSTDVPLVVHSFFDLTDAINHDGHTLPLLSIQVTELIDGIFIGGSVNHLLADGASFWHFMSAWSELFKSKGKDGYIVSRPPTFKRWVLEGYDPITNLPFTHHDQFISRSEKPQLKERFFHFSSYAIAKLKAKANKECNTQSISSLQAVSALLWRCITRARHQPRNSETLCKLNSNNRGRVKPPLSDGYFGSLIDVVTGTSTVEELMGHGLGWAALRLHDAVKNHDHTAVKKLAESWYRNPVVFKMSGPRHPNTIHVGSSPRFDMYGCEFGLGKAVAARSGFVNKEDGTITMYPGRDGDGSMDVEVCLLPDYMMDLESDEELQGGLNGNKVQFTRDLTKLVVFFLKHKVRASFWIFSYIPRLWKFKLKQSICIKKGTKLDED